MPIPKSLLNFLDKNKIKHEILKHRVVFTAHDKAATLKLKPAQVAKSVVVSLDKKDHALALIPANKNLDKKKLLALTNKTIGSPSYLKKSPPASPSFLKRGLPARNDMRSVSGGGRVKFSRIDFADERWMKANLKGIKVGATPAFGIIYKLPTFIDNALLKSAKLVTNAGDYQYSFKITPAALLKADPGIAKGSFSLAKK